MIIRIIIIITVILLIKGICIAPSIQVMQLNVLYIQ